MMSLRRIFGLMLLFFFFEAVVALATTLAFPNVNVFQACVAMTGLAVAVWAAFALITRVLLRPRAPQPQAPPVPRPATAVGQRLQGATSSFAQELNVLIAEANRRLAGSPQSSPGGEAPAIENLPLYLVVGGEGAGKTSAIRNSGLEPRLLAGEAEREGAVVPTRVCNLWFAEGAVFADIAGRVVAQEAENWEHALRVFSQPGRVPRWRQLLFGRRVRSNLRGVILVSDTNGFGRAGDPQRTTAFARTLNERLQTVGAVFRRAVPVYLIFTKSDSIEYFGEFFAQLSESENRSLVGATLPFAQPRNEGADIYAEREAKRLSHYLNRLYMSLAEKRLVLLSREDQAAKKSKVYEFPRELKKLRGDMVQFLLDVFRPNPLQASPQLRGFYLSGQRYVARNAGAAVDATETAFTVAPRRLDATVFFRGSADMRTVAAARGASPPGSVPRWMFLSDLFNRVILKDSAGEAQVVENTPDRDYRHLALAAAGAVLLGLSFLWANSWRNNLRLLDEVDSTVARAGGAASLSDIESLRAALVRLLDYGRAGAPLSYRWGLYSGEGVSAGLNRLYFDRFRRMFMLPMLRSLVGGFSRLDAGEASGGDVYDRLKAYRMITSGECKPESEFLAAQLPPIWSRAAAPGGADTSGLGERQIDFYVSELVRENPYRGGEVAEDNRAVTEAQSYLRGLHGPDRVFRALISQTDHDHAPDMLSRYVPNYTQVIGGPNAIEAAYTPEGWQALIGNLRSHKLSSVGEPCVIGAHSAADELMLNVQTEREVEDLYTRRYIEQWKTFLASHHVEPFRTNAEAVQRLHILADNNRSPLLGLIYMTSHDTSPVDNSPGAVAESVAEKTLERKTESVTNRIRNIFGTKENGAGTAANPAAETFVGAARIASEFSPVHAVVDPAHPERWLNPSNQAYMQALEELANAIAALPKEIDDKDPGQQQALERAARAVDAARSANHALGAMVPNTSSRVDVTVTSLFDEPINYAERIISSLPHMYANDPALVNRSAKSLCSSIDGLWSKYPFNRAAAQEATLQELNQAFAPGNGAFGIFAHMPAVLRVYQRQGAAWTPNPSFRGQLSQPFLQSLNNLSEFSDALYAGGPGAGPHFDYTLTLDGTGGVPVELDVDGHTLLYHPKVESHGHFLR
ncbi:MAG: hypothetical protein J2P13_07675, partial [Acidobacteria bacterium]|nr:hypothetical protein [Acidobacteriota bacterium]